MDQRTARLSTRSPLHARACRSQCRRWARRGSDRALAFVTPQALDLLPICVGQRRGRRACRGRCLRRNRRILRLQKAHELGARRRQKGLELAGRAWPGSRRWRAGSLEGVEELSELKRRRNRFNHVTLHGTTIGGAEEQRRVELHMVFKTQNVPTLFSL
jgi:hypothetical protein